MDFNDTSTVDFACAAYAQGRLTTGKIVDAAAAAINSRRVKLFLPLEEFGLSIIISEILSTIAGNQFMPRDMADYPGIADIGTRSRMVLSQVERSRRKRIEKADVANIMVSIFDFMLRGF